MKNVILNAEGTTGKGIELIRGLNLNEVTSILVKLEGDAYSAGWTGGPANVTLEFADGSSRTIINGFGIGYGGTGPWGIHDILRDDFHIEETEAAKVFQPGIGSVYYTIR